MDLRQTRGLAVLAGWAPCPSIQHLVGRSGHSSQSRGPFLCGFLAKSLIILRVPFGERSGYISVFRSIQQSKTHCCTLQAPELWKSRRSPTKLSQIMSIVLQVAHKPEAHHCLPARNSNCC